MKQTMVAPLRLAKANINSGDNDAEDVNEDGPGENEKTANFESQLTANVKADDLEEGEPKSKGSTRIVLIHRGMSGRN